MFMGPGRCGPGSWPCWSGWEQACMGHVPHWQQPTEHCGSAPHSSGPGLLPFSHSERSTQMCRPGTVAGPGVGGGGTISLGRWGFMDGDPHMTGCSDLALCPSQGEGGAVEGQWRPSPTSGHSERGGRGERKRARARARASQAGETKTCLHKRLGARRTEWRKVSGH